MSHLEIVAEFADTLGKWQVTKAYRDFGGTIEADWLVGVGCKEKGQRKFHWVAGAPFATEAKADAWLQPYLESPEARERAFYAAYPWKKAS